MREPSRVRFSRGSKRRRASGPAHKWCFTGEPFRRQIFRCAANLLKLASSAKCRAFAQNLTKRRHRSPPLTTAAAALRCEVR